LLKLQSENDEKIKRDKTRIEGEAAKLINLQSDKIADDWIDFKPVFANVTTSVIAEWLTHMSANINPSTGAPTGPPEECMRYISSYLMGVNISDRSESQSGSNVIGSEMKTGTKVTLTIEINTTSLPLPVDYAIVRARLSERIDALDGEIARSPSLDRQEARTELRRRLALFQS